SVYFPNYVIPMLPEVLSNGLCSLNPHVPRLCVVAEILFNFQGEKIEAKFYEAVMESKARVTYGRAQEVIDGVVVPELEHVRDNILRLADLAKILMAKRFREGSLDLEIPETTLEIDAAGNPIDVIRAERLFAHRLIEEMMLAANVAVAEFLSGCDIPAIYRIHEPPKPEAIAILERYLMNFGSKFRLRGEKLQKKLGRALQEFSGRPEATVLNILALRSMQQARYSHENVGHFGLGFSHYTHFTSPIRRYPDLIVHRLLKSQILQNSEYVAMSEEDLASASTWLSACEQRATKCERQIQSIKKARFMEKFVGQEFDGVVSSVTKFGIFVLLREHDCDGLVNLEALGDGHWEFDEENLRLVASRSGFSYSIGDIVRVQVAAADPMSGKVDFVLSEESQKGKNRQNAKELPLGQLNFDATKKRGTKKVVHKKEHENRRKSRSERRKEKYGEQARRSRGPAKTKPKKSRQKKQSEGYIADEKPVVSERSALNSLPRTGSREEWLRRLDAAIANRANSKSTPALAGTKKKTPTKPDRFSLAERLKKRR
ncbi:MAG: RNB domain-containing ribonuclease, partial [Bdellovibrionaceae bacterium]|nr:RNB domain-containing ribonuclease [Pseudobdellovibrionaceae bacterium]